MGALLTNSLSTNLASLHITIPTGRKTGPNTLWKVMAGHGVAASTRYFYKYNVSTQSLGDKLTTAVLTSLIGAITGSAVIKGLKSDATAINITIA